MGRNQRKTVNDRGRLHPDTTHGIQLPCLRCLKQEKKLQTEASEQDTTNESGVLSLTRKEI